jgi:mRNA interferase RelE/StbE
LSSEFRIAETDHFKARIERPELRQVKNKLHSYVYPQLRTNPFFGPHIRKLKGKWSGVYRFRVGRWRLFYTIDKENVLVLMLEIEQRQRGY